LAWNGRSQIRVDRSDGRIVPPWVPEHIDGAKLKFNDVIFLDVTEARGNPMQKPRCVSRPKGPRP
jgi:hypothetical protein